MKSTYVVMYFKSTQTRNTKNRSKKQTAKDRNEKDDWRIFYLNYCTLFQFIYLI